MPGAGPILLFDKSVLQALTVDEAVWLDTFYFPCITPLFFVETLADLEKEVEKGRTPEDVVGNLAEKTPFGGAINVHHATILRNELLGRRIELRHVPAVAGGSSVRTREGGKAVVFGPPPESEALHRWRERSFLEVEHDFAKSWREGLSNIDLEALFGQGRDFIRRWGRPRDLAAAKNMAKEILAKPGARFVRERLQGMQPPGFGEVVLKRWIDHGSPPIRKYAPFASHVMLVDLFFRLGLGADLIGRERASNTIDLAYLYYLPFCMAFTSNDNFHARTAPLFLDEGQMFLPGGELKSDLARLDEHYSRLPDEVKTRGVMSFAHFPPVDGDFLVSKLWDRLMRPEWRIDATQPPAPKSPEANARIVSAISELADAPRTQGYWQVPTQNPEAVLIERVIPAKRGKWLMVPPEALEAQRSSKT